MRVTLVMNILSVVHSFDPEASVLRTVKKREGQIDTESLIACSTRKKR